MGILLAFAPFVAFAIVDRFVGSMPGLIEPRPRFAKLVQKGIAGHLSAPCFRLARAISTPIRRG
jgi:hypothetical protein